MDDEAKKEWTRAPEEKRCMSTLTWPDYTNIGTVRCDLEAGHDGQCGYMAWGGVVVYFDKSAGV